MTAVGILGGSFNPPHLGHLALAEDALAELGLERVMIVPVCVAPHRPVPTDDPGAEHRLAMCRALFAGHPQLEVSTLEIDRGGRSYTVDTLRSVNASDPDAELTVILGADVASSLPTWRMPHEILSLARVAVAERGPATGGKEPAHPDVVATIAAIDEQARVTLLNMGPVAVSSTLVRERLAGGQAIVDLVGPEVAHYIAAHGLYATPDRAAVS